MAAGRDRSFVRLLPLLALYLFVSIVIDPGRSLTGDERPLLAAAGRLLQGRYAVIGTMTPVDLLWHGPGLPAVLAPFVALGIPLDELRLATPLLMFGAIALFNRLLQLRMSPRLALAGAYALGLYFPAYYVFGTVAKEPLALLLSVLALYGSALYLQAGRRRHGVLAGLALAGLAMTRLEYGWVTAFMLVAGLLWLAVARRRLGARSAQARAAGRWVLICTVAMLACLPWLGYTYAITGLLFYWGNAGGSSLYWMSSPSPTQFGQWHSGTTVFRDPSLASYRPLFRHLATLPPVERDLALQHLALAQALGHPAKYALNMIANVGRMVIGFPFSFHLPAVAIAALAVVNGILVLGMLAAIASIRRHRATLPREAIPFLLFALAGFGIHLFPSAEPRMLVPLVPVPIWLIGQALAERGRAGLRVSMSLTTLSPGFGLGKLEPGPNVTAAGYEDPAS